MFFIPRRYGARLHVLNHPSIAWRVACFPLQTRLMLTAGYTMQNDDGIVQGDVWEFLALQ